MSEKKEIRLCYACADHIPSPRHESNEPAMRVGTGACGVDCNTCRLHIQGICSACGSGLSKQGEKKASAQRQLFGQACAILECAIEKGIAYCMRDCDAFPCETFEDNGYPFSKKFLSVQKRRREEAGDMQQAFWPQTTDFFWELFFEKPLEEIAQNTWGRIDEKGALLIDSLSDIWRLDPQKKTVVKASGAFGGEWDRQMPFLVLVYAASANPTSLAGETTIPKDLFSGVDIFQQSLALETDELEEAFGSNRKAFEEAAEKLSATKIPHADIAFRFRIFPKFPVDYLLWLKDDEFPARLSILLDKGTPDHLPADAISTLLNLLGQRLLMENR